MARVLVLGYGNPLRGDDGLGWHAAQMLAEAGVGEGVEVLACRQLTPDLSEPVSRAKRVILIDISTQDPPGKVCCRPVAAAKTSGSTFTHNVTPETLLQWAKELYGATPETLLISVGAGSLDFGEGLSQAVAQSLPALLACVREQIRGNREQGDGSC